MKVFTPPLNEVDIIEEITRLTGEKPCKDIVCWLLKNNIKTFREAWEKCDRISWLFWAAGKIGVDGNQLKKIVLAACEFVRDALIYISETKKLPYLKAIECAEAWAQGFNISLHVIEKVADAAYYATDAAVDSATYYAAYAAALVAYATSYAIYAINVAAYSSAPAAINAAHTAVDSTVDAAINVAYYAAYSVALTVDATDVSAAKSGRLKNYAILLKKHIVFNERRLNNEVNESI